MKRAEFASFDGIDIEPNRCIIYYSIEKYPIRYVIKIRDTSMENMDTKTIYPYAVNAALGIFPFVFAKYYPKTLIIRGIKLDDKVLKLYETWYLKGLGEFLYRNNLPFHIHVINQPGPNIPTQWNIQDNTALQEDSLLLNGGGKDSSVSAEILKASNIQFTWLMIGQGERQRNVVKRSESLDSIVVSMYSQLNKVPSGLFQTFAGHKPYTLMTSCLAVFVAGVTRKKYIIYSNEKSSNYSNLTVDGFEINHQYTKSLEFEQNYKEYLQQYVNPQLDYFSLLKPLYEVEISKIFSRFPQYHDVFVSCNTGRWCRRCSKCCFIYLSLFPFVDTKDLDKYIGRSILEGDDLIKTYEMLTGETEHKPFECVGTIEENRLAMQLCIDKNPDTVVTKHFKNKYQYTKPSQNQLDTILYHYDDDNHTIPEKWRLLVKQTILRLLKQPNSGQESCLEGFSTQIVHKNSYGVLLTLIYLMVIFAFCYCGFHMKLQHLPIYVSVFIIVYVIVYKFVFYKNSLHESFQSSYPGKLSIVPQMFLESAQELGIPYKVINARDSQLLIGEGDQSIYFRYVYNTLNNSEQVKLARNKYKTYQLFQNNNIPIPQFLYIDNLTTKSTDSIVQEINIPYPIVIKQLDGANGALVFVDIQNKKEAEEAIQILKDNKKDEILIEKHVYGKDFRVLVFDGEVIDVIHRPQPQVVGDGKQNIMHLIQQENAKKRKMGHHPIVVDKQYMIKKYGRLDFIPQHNEIVPLNCLTNFHQGSFPTRIRLDDVHPDNIHLFKHISEVSGLRLIGIDYLTPDITQSYLSSQSAINEINGMPNTDIHYYSDGLSSIEIPKKILKRFFSRGK
jgi:glutathione synthase/RimK-type ligase-like ATP-grasp enzyme